MFKDQIFGSNQPEFNNSEIASMPEIESIGDVDPDAEESIILYEVPELTGKYYYQLEDVEDYERFKFVIKDKEFSDKYERGTICAQSVAAGTPVENETEIQLTISLGPKEFTVANVIGLDEMSAKIELLKQGFLYENIKVEIMQDRDKERGVIIEQKPEYGETVTAESVIEIFINEYTVDEDEVVDGLIGNNTNHNDPLLGD